MNSKMANQVIGKLGPHLVQLESLTNKPQMQHVASVIREPCIQDLVRFNELSANAKAVIDSGGRDRLLCNDLKALASDVAQSKKNVALACQILATLARAPTA